MGRCVAYCGGLTAEQFLFPEMRLTAKLFLEGHSKREAIDMIQRDNLFQYPTEREVSRMAGTCWKRLEVLENKQLVHELAYGPIDAAKQIDLYSVMRYNGLVWEFMVDVIGEKLRNQDLSLTAKDMDAFFDDLQAKDSGVAGWSEGKSKGYLSECWWRQNSWMRQSPQHSILFSFVRNWSKGSAKIRIWLLCLRSTVSERGNIDMIAQELDKIKARLSDPVFLANKGLSNEVGIHVFCYPPESEEMIRCYLRRFRDDPLSDHRERPL